MSKIFQVHRRKVIGAGVLIGAYALVQNGTLPNPFYTPGVQNIEQRYSSGGAAPNKTPGAATKRGHPDSVTANTTTNKGIGTPRHEEKFGEQKPDPSTFDKTWNQAHYHEDKGK
ncbi:hypothetical protein N7G274_006982 [Stereocaulon virgatum]|uniref:Uncharacterized protein n=1 Tax=Stereocaulon virgatum TaxID=373712 RepID=A0ABR4A2B4_9LECA